MTLGAMTQRATARGTTWPSKSGSETSPNHRGFMGARSRKHNAAGVIPAGDVLHRERRWWHHHGDLGSPKPTSKAEPCGHVISAASSHFWEGWRSSHRLSPHIIPSPLPGSRAAVLLEAALQKTPGNPRGASTALTSSKNEERTLCLLKRDHPMLAPNRDGDEREVSTLRHQSRTETQKLEIPESFEDLRSPTSSKT